MEWTWFFIWWEKKDIYFFYFMFYFETLKDQVKGFIKWTFLILSFDRCIKAALISNIKYASWTTKASTELKHPKFGEEFRITIAEQQLINKTLQVQIWSIHNQLGSECLVSRSSPQTCLLFLNCFEYIS